jgi:hypothetical protein
VRRLVYIIGMMGTGDVREVFACLAAAGIAMWLDNE